MRDAPLTWCLARLADDGSVMVHDLRYIVASHVLLNAGTDVRGRGDAECDDGAPYDEAPHDEAPCDEAPCDEAPYDKAQSPRE